MALVLPLVCRPQVVPSIVQTVAIDVICYANAIRKAKHFAMHLYLPALPARVYAALPTSIKRMPSPGRVPRVSGYPAVVFVVNNGELALRKRDGAHGADRIPRQRPKVKP
jgi:hypothetical protein